MTDLSRRSFLRGALTLTVAAALPAVTLAPILYGDGVHDDADALNALFRGDPVICEGDIICVRSGGDISLKGGHFLVSKTVLVDMGDGCASIEGTKFTGTENFDGVGVLRFNCRSVSIRNSVLDWVHKPLLA